MRQWVIVQNHHERERERKKISKYFKRKIFWSITCLPSSIQTNTHTRNLQNNFSPGGTNHYWSHLNTRSDHWDLCQSTIKEERKTNIKLVQAKHFLIVSRTNTLAHTATFIRTMEPTASTDVDSCRNCDIKAKNGSKNIHKIICSIINESRDEI